MNKAFMKEEEGPSGKCPGCGSLGVVVRQATLAAHLAPDVLKNLTESAYFCPYAKCDVVYFDQFDRVVERSSLDRPVYPKDPLAPMCACFGFTEEEVEQDVREGVATRVRALLEKSKSPAAECVTKSPRGECCIPEVQKYFMKLRANWSA